jgi:hypothetical protein
MHGPISAQVHPIYMPMRRRGLQRKAKSKEGQNKAWTSEHAWLPLTKREMSLSKQVPCSCVWLPSAEREMQRMRRKGRTSLA